MIEYHDYPPRRAHLLMDEGGWGDLQRYYAAPESEPRPTVTGLSHRSLRIWGINVFRTDREGCPCTAHM